MAAAKDQMSLLKVLNGEVLARPPIWLMRQAGRYLPEYRELRGRAKSFLDFCYAPAMAAEVTLQPIRRFGFDASIIFSDILVIPDALGRKVWFVEGEGPRLEPLIAEHDWRFHDPTKVTQRLSPVYEAVERVRAALPGDVALIGFCGAPWTVATYMLQGEGGEKDRARLAAYQRPEEVDRLLATLVEASAHHLAAQVAAGAQCVQIFESWAEGLSTSLFERLVIGPNAALIARLRELGVDVPVIAFPRACGGHLARFATAVPAQAIGLDTGVDAAFARVMAPGKALQGNLDPQLLVGGGAALDQAVADILADFAGAPHIFNLGHGITPQADIAHVERLIRLVKG
jgi:uroporphyrinogen decarboxylase